jgi:hypothetical protein
VTPFPQNYTKEEKVAAKTDMSIEKKMGKNVGHNEVRIKDQNDLKKRVPPDKE